MRTIGVTGHRALRRPERVTAAIDTAFDEVLAATGWTHAHLVTSLAEGADRLAAERALARPGWMVDVVLPLEVEDYEGDFADATSVDAFEALVDEAETVELVDPQATREDAYLAAGLRMLERSDVLLAVWDGEPARGVGGTADIVARARAASLPLVWLCERDGDVVVTAEHLDRLAEPAG